MKIVLKNARIDNQYQDMVIEDGIIRKIGSTQEKGDLLLEHEGLTVTPGWFDFGAQFHDPGQEFKENLRSGLKTAAAGGYSRVAVVPNTAPALQTKESISYITGFGKGQATKPGVLGAVTKDTNGEDMTEMLDLHAAGVVAFSDGLNPIFNSDILLKTLLYLQQRNAVLVDRPLDPHLSHFGIVNEGPNSVLSGLNGISNLSEYLIVQRNIEILKYSRGRLHLTGISAEESVELIEKAQKEGLKLTCDVAIHNLIWTDESILDFDTNYKLMPPLRSKKDRLALIEGLKKGIITGITSHHLPQDSDHKDLEFDLAEYGIISLQTVFSMLVSIQDELPLDISIKKLYDGNRTCLDLDVPSIEEGVKADLTLLLPEKEWTFSSKTNQSLSGNSPLLGAKLKGTVLGVINGQDHHINDYE